MYMCVCNHSRKQITMRTICTFRNEFLALPSLYLERERTSKRERDKAYLKASLPTKCLDAFKIQNSLETLYWFFLDED